MRACRLTSIDCSELPRGLQADYPDDPRVGEVQVDRSNGRSVNAIRSRMAVMADTSAPVATADPASQRRSVGDGLRAAASRSATSTRAPWRRGPGERAADAPPPAVRWRPGLRPSSTLCPMPRRSLSCVRVLAASVCSTRRSRAGPPRRGCRRSSTMTAGVGRCRALGMRWRDLAGRFADADLEEITTKSASVSRSNPA